MTTPEATVKAAVRRLLDTYGDRLHAYWPVPSGFGRTSLDCLGCYRGRFFAIETKAPGKKLTLRQHTLVQEMQRAGGKVFIIDGQSSPAMNELHQWLDHLRDTIDDDPDITPDPVSRRPL